MAMHSDSMFQARRPVGQGSIVRSWVSGLSPRMQGVLLTAVRGSDTSPREAPIKTLARYYRGVLLHSMNDDPQTFMICIDYGACDGDDAHLNNLHNVMDYVLADHDAVPHHYLMHLIHAAQIVGAFHPHLVCRAIWNDFYTRFCRKMHMTPESRAELIQRLDEPDESLFASAQ